MPGLAEAAADAIVVRGASRHYGAVRAVDGAELRVRRGELFGLIGRNGAGKTTLFRMMLGLVPATAGEIVVDGTRVDDRRFRATRRQIGYLPENVVLYDNLTGLETLRFFGRLKRVDPSGHSALLERVGLAKAAHRPVREYSKGMRQRLGFAQALLGAPQILFLDEPTNGLDPEAIRNFYVILRGLRDQGTTIVLTSHILAEIQERVDRLAIMSAGRVQAVGTLAGLRESMDLPLRIEVRFDPVQAETVRAALRQVQCATVEEPHATPADKTGHLMVSCRREHKLELLALLSSLRDGVRDIVVHEPSLEDVFLGTGD